ncbi:MAG: S41 family peptidase [Deltaproteobacteria bacterium]|nr:S41 family peptidase [Deltaproteobacteria bacterium]
MSRTSRVALVAAVAFLAGLSLGQVARAAKREGTSYRPLDVFAEVLAHVENNYVEEVPEKELVYGAIEGLVGKLDPHSTFMRPEVYRQLKEETSGEFDGVGLELTVRADQITVVSPIPDSPGERAGILPGDRLLQIDGTSTRDFTLLDAIRKLKGAPGTRVTLQIMREGFQAPQDLTLLRDHIRTQSVEWRVLDRDAGLLYVRVKSFTDRTDRSLKRALEEGRTQLGHELGGLALDLRNNPGGLLDQAVRVSDRFLREGIIVTTEGRGRGNREVEMAHGKETEPDYPVVVLVNRGSASASEIVAGALQDHKRATILGTQSFGKGSVQTVIDLSDGSGLKLTQARYYTPKHRSIHELGITPDVVVAESPPAAPPAGAAPADAQLARAAEVLRQSPRKAAAGGARK